MATYSGQLRQGLPRVLGGEPWPAAGVAPIEGSVAATSADTSADTSAAPVEKATSKQDLGQLRRGLPRVVGGEPWPAGGAAPAKAAPVKATPVQSTPVQSTPPADAVEAAEGAEVRKGLPRVAGGKPWPESGVVPAWAVKRAPVAPAETPKPAAETPKPVAETPTPVAEKPVAKSSAPTISKPAAKAASKTAAKTAAKLAVKPKPREPIMIGEKTLGSWIKIGVLGAVGAVIAAAIFVLAARGVTTLPGVPESLQKYPGEYDPIAPVDPGFPVWARWSHFLNIFLMVLIIRSGILVRTQQKPPAFWTPKKGGKKISINLWLHTSLDIIWVVNGVIFVVLLFVSGHWLRIVPTSWEVFPNAASALLQYMTLDWPTDNGWVNYNSLQQLMYFIVIFIAAPLAIITGVRMSEWWPEKATRLNKIYPAPLARALHFPIMIFFVLFIIVHVFLVFATGALRNLNHMFAGTDVVNWTGFWLFALAIALTAAGWFAMKPLILAPIANLFGRVSNR